MSNVPFLSHPSFANVDRFEHSLGVAHLAWRWSNQNGLDVRTATALTLAGLYHDAATPAYGHLFEGYLKRWGFDHEAKLYDILIGKLVGRSGAQVFLGGSCQLPSELKRHPLYGDTLNEYVVADFAQGAGPLGAIIAGDIDLDNIDNVIRAATAMGLVSGKDLHPYDVTDSIVYCDGQLQLKREQVMPVADWMRMRSELYTRIRENEYEFRAQCALRWAIARWCIDLPTSPVEMWAATDPVLTFQFLCNNPVSKTLIDRLRLGKPPRLLFSARLRQTSLGDLGSVADRLAESLGEMTKAHVFVDYYLDKRHRSTRMPINRGQGLFVDHVGLSHLVTLSKANTEPELVIGAVVATQAELAHAARVEDVCPERDLALSDIEMLLTSEFKSSPIEVSKRWLGGDGETHATTQYSLFMADAAVAR